MAQVTYYEQGQGVIVSQTLTTQWLNVYSSEIRGICVFDFSGIDKICIVYFEEVNLNSFFKSRKHHFG